MVKKYLQTKTQKKPAYRLPDGIYKRLHKIVHARFGSLLKHGILYLNFDHNLQKLLFLVCKDT